MSAPADRLATLAWPAERLGEALAALAAASGLPLGSTAVPSTRVPEEPAALVSWIEAAAAALGLDAEPVEVPYAEVGGLVGRAAPALLMLPPAAGTAESATPRFLALAGRGRRRVALLGPDHRRHRVPVEAVTSTLGRAREAPLLPEIDRLLDTAGVAGRRRSAARRALLAERLGAAPLAAGVLLTLPAEAPFARQVRHARLPGLAGRMVGAHAAQHVLLLVAWWMLGRATFAGRLDTAWLAAWALLLLTVAPFRTLELWAVARLTARAGGLLKRRLLAGVLRLDPEEVRHQGIGQFLGRVINAEALEVLALIGGHIGLIALAEIVLAFPILVLGAGGWPHALLLALWVALAAALAWRYLRDRRRWTADRLAMTHDLIEQMVGHRTRLAQLPPHHWHDGEDAALAGYVERSAGMDRRAAVLVALVPRGWLLASLAVLALPFATGAATPVAVAVALGGALFAYKSLWKLVRGLSDLAEAAVAWEQVRPLFRAAARGEEAAPLFAEEGAAAPAGPGERPVVLSARDLAFRYGDRAEPVFAGLDLEVRAGDRLLLEGPSGSGKSTLAALLVGLREPRSGLLLLDGLDRHSLGAAGWRRRAVAAPQFQENHVLAETLLFNLLLGRGWPPSPTDEAEALAICRELGLGELLDRMPSGLLQRVGESGWQLSHGEKSRLFLARALLQRAELVVLDESFAALDPETLKLCLECALRRAGTLVVIAHP